MTLKNCYELLEKYKAQIDNPVSDTGAPLRADQRKHSISQSKHNYKVMLERIELKKAVIKERMNNTDPIFKTYWKYRNDPMFKETPKPKKASGTKK